MSAANEQPKIPGRIVDIYAYPVRSEHVSVTGLDPDRIKTMNDVIVKAGRMEDVIIGAIAHLAMGEHGVEDNIVDRSNWSLYVLGKLMPYPLMEELLVYTGRVVCCLPEVREYVSDDVLMDKAREKWRDEFFDKELFEEIERQLLGVVPPARYDEQLPLTKKQREQLVLKVYEVMDAQHFVSAEYFAVRIFLFTMLVRTTSEDISQVTAKNLSYKMLYNGGG